MEITAVEWLVKQINDGQFITDKLIEQAKVIDEQNIKKAWINGYNCRTNEDKIGGSGNEHNDYYNETFKNK